MYTPYQIDVSGRVNAIEGLKSQLLMDVANLYSLMAKRKESATEDYMDLFSDIIILTYLLSKQMGQECYSLDHLIAKKLRYHLIEGQDKAMWADELQDLLKHLQSRKA